MNKKIIFAIFLIFILGMVMVDQVEATISYNEDNNIFNSFSSWISSLFRTKSATESVNIPNVYSPEISDTPSQEEEAFKPEISQSNAYIKLTPNKGETGSIIVVKGYNFDPTVSSDIKYNILFGNTIVHTFYPYGPNFEETFIVPDDVDAIVNKVMVQEVQSAYDYFTIIPSGSQEQGITVDPTQGYVGEDITIYGEGFIPNSEDIIIRFDENILLGYVDADSNGNFVFNTQVPMPNDDQVFYYIEAVDVDGYIVYTTFVILWGNEQSIIAVPDTGYVGDDFTIYGTGFMPNSEDIIIRFDENILLGYVDADSNGNFVFNTQVPMPNDDQVFYYIEAVDVNGYIVYTTFVILWGEQLTLIATPDEGYVNDVIALEGTGYIPGDNLDIYMIGLTSFSETTLIAEVVVNDDGTFDTTFVVPNMALGTHNILVYGDNMVSMYDIFEEFTILENGTQPDLTLIATPDEGFVNDVISLEGTGYIPNTQLEIFLNPSDPEMIATPMTDANGDFVTTFVVPDLAPDMYIMNVFNLNQSVIYNVYEEFTILENGTQPDLTLIATPDEGYVNDVIALEGTGYIPGDTLMILFDNEVLMTQSMGSSGSFDTTFVVPDLAPGTYLINVYGTNMSSMYNVFEEFTILENGTQPDLTLIATPDEGYVNDVIALEGTGYIPGDTLMILFDNEVLMTQSMGSSGSFDTTFVVPDLAPGTYLINVYGTNMSSMYNVFEEFTILENGTQPDDPSITLSAPGGHPGETRTVYGHDFDDCVPGEIITIRLAGIVIAQFTWYGSEFEEDFIVPDIAPGNNYLVSVDNYPTAYAYFDVLEEPSFPPIIFVNPEQGYAGDIIDIWGYEFGVYETLTILIDGQVIATPTTNGMGGFTDVFNVPDIAPGVYTITVQGYNATAQFEVLDNGSPTEPVIFVDPTSGYPGDVIDVWGYNFTANTNLTLYLGPEFVVTVMTDNDGSFTGQFTVPSMAAGLYDVSVIGYSATTPFLVLELGGNDPDLFVNPDSGYADDVIMLSGIYFGPNETLVIYLDGEVIVMPTTDANGAFITTFVVPNWTPGDYEITVFSYTVSEDFEILETEEEEEEEEEQEDDDDGDDIPRERHQYYMEGLTCSESVDAGKTGMLSFEVVNRGITDEQDMIVAVWCEALGINLIYEDIVLERLEPNLIEIPINIPGNVESGEYSCMIELYSETYAYEKLNRVTDSINFVVEGESVEDISVIYLADANEEEVVQESKSSWGIFTLSILILALIVFFVYRIYALTRRA